MTFLLNPNYKPHLDLVATDEIWDALKSTVTDWLNVNAGAVLSDADVAAIRALDTQLADERIWSQIASDLGLDGIA